MQLQNPWQVYSVRDLSGGVNLASNDFIHGVDELNLTVNFNLNRLGSVQKIFGYSVYGTKVTNASEILGIGNFYYSTGQKQLLGVDLEI